MLTASDVVCLFTPSRIYAGGPCVRGQSIPRIDHWSAHSPCACILRGGSWNNTPQNLRAANRNR